MDLAAAGAEMGNLMSEPATINPFDQLVQTDDLQMVKAAMPYINTRQQKPLLIFVKLLELRNSLHLLTEDDERLSACSVDRDHASPLEMLQAIRNFCPPRQQESIDAILNFMNVYQFYNMYQSLTAGGSNEDGAGSQVEQLKNMLSPEQRHVFETYLANIT